MAVSCGAWELRGKERMERRRRRGKGKEDEAAIIADENGRACVLRFCEGDRERGGLRI